MTSRDNIVAEGMPGLTELGVVPTPVELVVPGYLRRFQPGGGNRRESRRDRHHELEALSGTGAFALFAGSASSRLLPGAAVRTLSSLQNAGIHLN